MNESPESHGAEREPGAAATATDPTGAEGARRSGPTTVAVVAAP